MRIMIKLGALLFVTTFLVSCASTSLVDTWRNPNVRGEKLRTLLVVKIERSLENRRMTEDVLVNELRTRGVNAMPGYQHFPGNQQFDKRGLQTAVTSTGAEAVLTLKTTNIQRQTDIQPGYATSFSGYAPYGPYGGWGPSAFSSWDLYGDYGASTMLYQPPSAYNYDISTIQINLFEARSGKLIWAATTQTSEPADSLSVSKDIARIVIKALGKEGLM